MSPLTKKRFIKVFLKFFMFIQDIFLNKVKIKLKRTW